MVQDTYNNSRLTLKDIIEVDGINVQNLSVESIQIFAGQRYSFILNANKEPGNYWIRSNPNVGPTKFGGGINSAILRYVDQEVKNTDPITEYKPRPVLKETQLQPFTDPAAPGPPVPAHQSQGEVIGIQLAISYNATKDIFSVNDHDFVPPVSVPVLLQILNGRRPEELIPAGSIYQLPPNKVIELNIPGGSPASPVRDGLAYSCCSYSQSLFTNQHPIHLHGHAFSVVRSAGSDVYNYNNPVRRDVVNAGGGGDNVTIRFQTDNAGPWILHW